MAVTHTPHIPRPALLGAGLMMAATFVAAAWSARLAPSSTDFEGPTSQLRELRFADRADGAVSIVDAQSGRTIETLHGEHGFVRGVLRGLAQERLRRGLDGERPFLLIVGGSGRLALVDPATQRRVDLESFGRDNAAVFARWLNEGEGEGEGVASAASARSHP
jgi:putative photosynthetic complex assembly protein